MAEFPCWRSTTWANSATAFRTCGLTCFRALQGRATRVSYDERHDTLGWLFAQKTSLGLLLTTMLMTYGTSSPLGVCRHRTPWPASKQSHRQTQTALLLKRQFPTPVRQDASHFVQEAAGILLARGSAVQHATTMTRSARFSSALRG